MRVAIVTESFMPQVNGVTNPVRRGADHQVDNGHDAPIVARAPGLGDYGGVPVARARSTPSVRALVMRSRRIIARGVSRAAR